MVLESEAQRQAPGKGGSASSCLQFGRGREKERPDRCLQVVRDEEEVVKQREDRCWLGEGAKVSFRDAGDETRAIVVKGGATAQRQALGEVARV